MKWTEMDAGDVNAATQRLLCAMGKNADTICEKIISDRGMAYRLMKLALTDGYALSTSFKRARSIMTTNCFGLFDADQRFGIKFTAQQLTCLSEVPFPEGVLEASKDTHVLVVVPTMSILDLRSIVVGMKLPSKQKRLFSDQGWYNNEVFAKSKREWPDWYLVPKTNEADVVVGGGYEPHVMTYAIIGHFLTTGERLFEKSGIRCCGVDSRGKPIYVGPFSEDGLSIGCSSLDRRGRGLSFA